MKNLRIPLLLTFILYGFSSKGQIEMSSFTATGRAGVSSTLLSDYQCQGINPANLAFRPEKKNKNFSIGFGELSFSIYSDALSRINLSSALFNPEKKLNSAEKRQAAQDFTNKALTMNFDFLYGGFSWQSDDGLSGFAFTIRERAQWYSKFSQRASELMFNGINARFQNAAGQLEYYFQKIPNGPGGLAGIDTIGIRDSLSALKLSTILDGSRIAMGWNREYAFDYGVNILKTDRFKLNIGAGIRYIQGIGYMDLQADGSRYKAVIAASPAFGIRFPEKSQDTVNVGFLPNSAGSGVGFEFGVSAEIGEHWRIAGSITDLGSVSYKTNVYTASDGPLTSISTQGFSSYNFFQNASQFDGFTRDLVKWQSDQRELIALPSKFRFGGSYSSKIVNVGFDLVTPLNTVAGNILRPVISAGGDVKILGIFRLSTGIMQGGNYSNLLIPAGITFSPVAGYYELGIATRDLFTYLRSKNPMISLSVGFMRFRF
jgi:hypothetical protein